jgi:hypothetical protein
MKPGALRIERMLEKIEAKLVPPPRKWLRVIIHEGDAEAVVKETGANDLPSATGPAHPRPCSSLSAYPVHIR